jgi:hypothetical protein
MVFKRKNKKGNAIIEWIFIIVIVFIFGLVVLINYNWYEEVYPEMVTDLQNEGAINESIDALTTVHTDFPIVFDGLVLFVLIGLWIASLVGAFLVDVHPLFFVVAVFILVISLIVAAALSNSVQDLLDDDVITVQDSFPITNWIFNNLFVISIIISFSILIILFGKRGNR